nr:unnamed protein product [Callosobruchus analis]
MAKQVKRNRSKLFSGYLRLKKQLEDLNKKYKKYKKIYHREKQKRFKKKEDISYNDREKYLMLSNIEFEEKAVTSARKKTHIIGVFYCGTRQGYTVLVIFLFAWTGRDDLIPQQLQSVDGFGPCDLMKLGKNDQYYEYN